MNPKASRQNRQILEEASGWFVALRDGALAETAREEFHDWLKRSPEHIRAYLEIASVYADIPAPEYGRTPPALIAKARSSADVAIVPLRPGGLAAAGRSGEGIAHLLRGRSVAVATLLLVFMAVGAWFHADRNVYRTEVGEQRSLTLADGSVVELNARTRLRIAFRERERGVELLEGQALFRVARDAARPFIVRAGVASVRAVGTQFDVYRKSTGTVVTVIEGRVAVTSASMSGPATPDRMVSASEVPTAKDAALLLAAGEQARVAQARAMRVERANVAAATAWTRRQLVFDATPLAEVLEEFSRYTPQRFVVESPELANLRISGQYISTTPDSLLRFLSLQKGVVITEAEGEIRIRQE